MTRLCKSLILLTTATTTTKIIVGFKLKPQCSCCAHYGAFIYYWASLSTSADSRSFAAFLLVLLRLVFLQRFQLPICAENVNFAILMITWKAFKCQEVSFSSFFSFFIILRMLLLAHYFPLAAFFISYTNSFEIFSVLRQQQQPVCLYFETEVLKYLLPSAVGPTSLSSSVANCVISPTRSIYHLSDIRRYVISSIPAATFL